MTTFQLYFASLAAWVNHPGYLREGSDPPTLEECADMAERMVLITEEREKWVGDLQQQPPPAVY